MTKKLLEVFFRHKWLITLPPILITLIVTPIAFLISPPYYEASAGIWVDRPDYLTYNDNWNQYITPAQNQSGALTELLKSRSFQTNVARRTSLAPLADTNEGQKQLDTLFQKRLYVFANGAHLLELHFRAPTPQLALEMTNAAVSAFRETASAQRVNQANLATTFYQARLQSTEDQLSKSTDAVRRYIAANPRLSAIDANAGAGATTAARLGLPAAAVDPTLADLLRQLDADQKSVDRASQSLEQARYDSAAAIEGQQLGFQLIDAPKLPTELSYERKKIGAYVAAGLLAGLGISATLLMLLTAADRSVRYEAELAALVPGTPVLGSVPLMSMNRLPKTLRLPGQNAARYAVGLVAATSAGAVPATNGISTGLAPKGQS
jgi:uncharacterized protein involved in exopolysaccharide biosynthesis